MTTFAVVAWLALTAFLLLFNYAAGGGRSLWLHTHFPIHRQRMARAQLCMEAAEHFGYPFGRTWIHQAYRLCDECGCPPDLWPVEVLKIHAGTAHV